ncbi:Tetratricopeptide TPR-1 and Tetratricopeptide TPR2 domain containing protein [Aphelenchoides fujianensis]|nr:Tetratricopeptide TPR-1 and Tetratricopeptide TPR2 domain containing protein [Aphelenchoides fujianensis]
MTTEEIRRLLDDFCVANFAHAPRNDPKEAVDEKTLERLTVDFVRPHECTRRLDFLLRIKEELLEGKATDLRTPANFLLALKAARIYNAVMRTSSTWLEQKIAEFNWEIAERFCEPHFAELEVDRADLRSRIRRYQSAVEEEEAETIEKEADGTKVEGALRRAEFFEWLLLNFSLWMEATVFHQAAFFLQLAARFSGLQLEFGGALGRRTRFQQRSLPQLIVKTESSSMDGGFFPLEPVDLPSNVDNRDDTVLEKLRLDDGGDSEPSGRLNAEQTACVLAATWLRIREDPVVELRFETIEAMVNKVLAHSTGFMTTLSAFILRSEAERLNTRRVERACQQMEALVDLLENRGAKPVDEAEARRRLQDLFIACPLQPIWEVKKFYAKVLMSLALTSEAIAVYESIHDWENVVEGYAVLNMKEKALGILESLHEQHPQNPYFLCLIGEIRRDEKTLGRVLELTDDRYFKAHKALGMMALEAKNYAKAFQHLKRVFELHPLSIQAVYNCGVAAMEIGELREAIRAFHHCASVDPENYRAWNNLAAAYVQTNQKARAVQVLKQALLVNGESERMWSNLFEVAAELSSKRECLLALKRYLGFQPKDVNVQPLLKIILANTTAAAETAYPAPPLHDPLPHEDLRLLVECMNEVHERVTLEPMALRLMAHLQKPAADEQNPRVFERFVELMDLAENRELKQTKEKPDYANVLLGLMANFEVRKRYAQLTGKNVDSLMKVMGYRIRPLLKKIEAERFDEAERARLDPIVKEAKTLLAAIS